MCYSAQIEADYRKYVKRYGADIGIAQFVRLYWDRSQGTKVKIAKAMDAAFADPQSPIWSARARASSLAGMRP